MICKFCGKELEEDSQFCEFCGKPVRSDTSKASGKEWRIWLPVVLVCLVIVVVELGIFLGKVYQSKRIESTHEDVVMQLPPLTGVPIKTQDEVPIAAVPALPPESDAAPRTDMESSPQPEPDAVQEPDVKPASPSEPESDPQSPADTEPTVQPDFQPEPVISGFDAGFWDQDFYGFALITNSTGVYADGISDFLMLVNLNDAGDGGSFALRGESCSSTEANVTCEFHLTDGVTSRGSLVSDSLWFNGNETMVWEIDPGTGFTANYDNMISMTGHFVDDRGTFDYSFFFRPWGSRWEDVAADLPTHVPRRYQDWYLPLLEANSEMPYSFG